MTDASRAHSGHQRLAGLLIAGAALLEMVFIIHHPIAPRAQGSISFRGIDAVMKANLAFHAMLMVIVMGQLLGLVLFARYLGLHRPIALAGVILSMLASIMLIVAMTFDGFVTYEMVSACSATVEGCSHTVEAPLQVVTAAIQAFTKLGIGAQCLGFGALALGMWDLGKWARLPALICVAFVLGPILLILLRGQMGPSQLAEIVAFQAAWGICVAVTLARGSLRDGSTEYP